VPANDGVSNLALSPGAVSRLGRELRGGRYDVMHVHEPNAPVVSWYATELATAPLVGTFHSGSTKWLSNTVASRLLSARRIYSKLRVRIAVSEAARWTAERFYGGRYRVVPNGVDLGAVSGEPKPAGSEFRVLFIGRADERKGLPVLLRAFQALRAAGVPGRLTVAGPKREDVEPYLLEDEGIEFAGAVDGGRWQLLEQADVLCAPSLGGESFGMVLTEAFAAATPVVCSDIAGYRDVARHGREGLLVPPGRPVALAEALHALALDPARRTRMAAAARDRAEAFAWSRVAEDVVSAYDQALAAPEPATRAARAATSLGLAPAAPGPRVPPRRIPPLEPRRRASRSERLGRIGRRVAIGAGAVAAVGLTALALSRIGLASIVGAVLAATPIWVFAALAVMCASMLVRAEAWRTILRAALPGVTVRRADTARATMIGVLMSATLPARLGEPSRALIMARRLGGVRERLPLVLGTLVSQTLLNLVALVVLGSIMLATVGLFRGREQALVAVTLIPLLLLCLVLVAPVLLRGGKTGRSARLAQIGRAVRAALVQARRGLEVFRKPRMGALAAATQLSAWVLQWFACYLLLVALGLDERAGLGAAAAVLFAVNVTAALPATPSNVGVFQAVCVAVLSAYGIGYTDALAYGIVLQALELATSLALGMPALVREGMSWRDMRLRALHAAPVELASAGSAAAEPAEA
jgi:phosphatidylinositol alpha-mannosyltransferase